MQSEPLLHVLTEPSMNTQTVYVKSDNKGLAILIGLVVSVVWFRYWWLGSLHAALFPHFSQDGEQFGSATGSIASDKINFPALTI